MTLFQIIPADLHDSFFFKVMQSIMKQMHNKEEIRRFKYGLFMILHVETRVNLASKFNTNMRDSIEELGNEYLPRVGEPVPTGPNYTRDFTLSKAK